MTEMCTRSGCETQHDRGGYCPPCLLGVTLDVTAVLTRLLASMVACPTCGVLPPRPCFADGSVHPLRISNEETTRDA